MKLVERLRNFDGGIRGSHILKALSKGANACSGGRLYLYALAAGGEKGYQSIRKFKNEVDMMKLMGTTKISQLNKTNLDFPNEILIFIFTFFM